MEGIIIGLFSGIVSLGIISGLYMLMSNSVKVVGFLSAIGLKLLEFNEMFNFILIVYLILGIGIGVLGSAMSMKKYLKV